MISLQALPGLPEITPGDDLAQLIILGLNRVGGAQNGDIIAISHKVVSKAEGQLRQLSEFQPTTEAEALAKSHGKDPRHIEAILQESAEILRADDGRLICRTHHGWVCANAGVDTSNSGDPDTLILLPQDPDHSARQIRDTLNKQTQQNLAVIITDSFGRPWRKGQSEIAIGCAGINPLADWRGKADNHNRPLKATLIAIADQVAAAADLARNKTSNQPAVRIRGLKQYVTLTNGPGASALRRGPQDDLFP